MGTECLYFVRRLIKLVSRGPDSSVLGKLGRGLVMHRRNVDQNGVMAGTSTPSQEMKQGIRARLPGTTINLCCSRKEEINLTANAVMFKSGRLANTTPRIERSEPMSIGQMCKQMSVRMRVWTKVRARAEG